jgi:3-hydroxyacyl-CoA dehydrogenase
VIGAGTMGAGIAICFANAGIPVALIDAASAGLERGMATIRGVYDAHVEKGRLSADARDRTLQLITPSLDLAAAVADVDLVVEAVFEQLDLKRPTRRCSISIRSPPSRSVKQT